MRDGSQKVKSPSCAKPLSDSSSRPGQPNPPPTSLWGGGFGCQLRLGTTGGGQEEGCAQRRVARAGLAGEARGHSGGNSLRFSFRLVAGDAQARVAGSHQFAVAPAVALEGHGGAVEVATVGLEGEAVL